MTPTLRVTSPQLVWTSYVALTAAERKTTESLHLTFVQKIRTIELDGKTVKLQIVGGRSWTLEN
jgi:hypothetical protein